MGDQDTARNARLILGGRRPASGRLRRALRSGRVPPFPVRVAQRVAMKAGVLDHERGVVRQRLALRRAALGDEALGPPRFLIRVDEFPHYLAGDEPGRFGLESSKEFHSVLASAGAPYLMAVVPRVTHRPLDPRATGSRPLAPDEIAFLGEMARERVDFGLHGYDHRTRYRSPRRRSELCGLSRAELEARIDSGLEELAAAGVHPRVFVPPFNRFDAAHWEPLARRFDVICGGPETVTLLGYHPGPQWRGDAVYLPCYPPLYGSAAECLPVVRQMIERQVGLWLPIVLHPGWERGDRHAGLAALAREIQPYASSWGDFIAAVDKSR
jgi:peptidoglycan/xylan/chitin deacetylase (PgdA/CDA1 family)